MKVRFQNHVPKEKPTLPSAQLRQLWGAGQASKLKPSMTLSDLLMELRLEQ
jgi:hypothetical protein